MKDFKILFAAGLAALTAGCTDLDVTPDSQYVSYPTSEAAVEAQMSSVYFKMREDMGRRWMEGTALTSDEFTAEAFGGGYYDGGTYAHAAFHTTTSEDPSMPSFELMCEGVVAANEVIDSEASAENRAKARAMRAYFTFCEMEFWGDAPINDSKLEGKIDREMRQPRAEVAKWIEQELLEIIPDLPTELNEESYGKPTKYMAEALLAKLYINWPVYTAESVDKYDAATAKNEKLNECVKICDDIINSKKFELGPDEYRFKFSYDNSERWSKGTIKDFIYVMPFDAITATGMQYGRPRFFKDSKAMKPTYFGTNISQSAGGNIACTPEIVDLFNLPGDQRNLNIIGLTAPQEGDPVGTVYVRDPQTLLPTADKAIYKDAPLVLQRNIKLRGKGDYQLEVGNDRDAYCQGYRSGKWFVYGDQYNNGRNQSNDVPIFRYADILLMKAEALTRGASASSVAPASALECFNKIREYAKAPLLTAAPTLNDIYAERGREFFDENWRRNDMIRFGHFEDEFFPHYKKATMLAKGAFTEGLDDAWDSYVSFDKTHRVFPVAKGMLDRNPKWNQNAGY